MPNNNRSFDGQSLHNGSIISDNTREVVATVRLVAFTMTALIKGSNVISLLSKERCDKIPDMSRRCEAMKQQDGWEMRMYYVRRPAKIVQMQAVGRYKTICGLN